MNAALTRGRWLLLAAAGVAAACSDAAGPIRPAPRFGAAAAGTTGITLDQFSGIANDPELWGQGQTHVGKNFVANPHRGDAVVATFFWRGSSNTIVGVTDHLCDVNNTPVGNTYTLVDYATQGGYSMATYVATNIQNFPDPAPTSDQLLCVHAIFSGQLSEAGMIISAYQGVDPNAATALGAHRTASGSASTTSPEGPGPIPVGGGALAYAATVSAPIGTDPPAGFTDLTEVDDNVDKADAEYEVFPGGGTADPTWTWYFTSPARGRPGAESGDGHHQSAADRGVWIELQRPHLRVHQHLERPRRLDLVVRLDLRRRRHGRRGEPGLHLRGGRHLHGHPDRHGQSGGDELRLPYRHRERGEPAPGRVIHVELRRTHLPVHQHQQRSGRHGHGIQLVLRGRRHVHRAESDAHLRRRGHDLHRHADGHGQPGCHRVGVTAAARAPEMKP